MCDFLSSTYRSSWPFQRLLYLHRCHKHESRGASISRSVGELRLLSTQPASVSASKDQSAGGLDAPASTRSKVSFIAHRLGAQSFESRRCPHRGVVVLIGLTCVGCRGCAGCALKAGWRPGTGVSLASASRHQYNQDYQTLDALIDYSSCQQPCLSLALSFHSFFDKLLLVLLPDACAAMYCHCAVRRNHGPADPLFEPSAVDILSLRLPTVYRSQSTTPCRLDLFSYAVEGISQRRGGPNGDDVASVDSWPSSQWCLNQSLN
jgi:hypothetical protein